MNDAKKLDMEELKNVTGGDFYPVWTADGYFEIWQICSYCRNYEELRLRTKSGEPDTAKYCSKGTMVCPKCGYKENYNISN